jgi:hypothetical protein
MPILIALDFTHGPIASKLQKSWFNSLTSISNEKTTLNAFILAAVGHFIVDQLLYKKKFSCIRFQTRFQSSQLAENAIQLVKTLLQLTGISIQLAETGIQFANFDFQTNKLH